MAKKEREKMMSEELSEKDEMKQVTDIDHEGRIAYEMDIDRMVNEGLGGGYVNEQNGHIGDSTVDFM